MELKPLSRMAFGLLLLTSLFGCGTGEIFTSSWKPSPVKVDGYATEWEVPLRYYDNETRLNYNIANNDDHLYVCIRVTDELSQMKILRAGIQLWIDTTGKKQQQVGVLFPVAGSDNMMLSSKRTEQANAESNKNKMRKKLLSTVTDMQLVGFKAPIVGITPISNTFGIKAAINWDSSNVMIYEMTIPFKTFYHKRITAGDTTKVFGFSATINGLPVPKHDGDGAAGAGPGPGMGGAMNAGGMGGAMGGGMAGGMRGGAMRGGGNSNNPLYETNRFWIKFRLSAK